MPDFYIDDLDISPRDFVYACSDMELTELVEILTNEGVIKSRLTSINDNIMDEMFIEALEKLAESRHKLTNEDEEIIKIISSRL
jgi:hypothetical protein